MVNPQERIGSVIYPEIIQRHHHQHIETGRDQRQPGVPLPTGYPAHDRKTLYNPLYEIFCRPGWTEEKAGETK